MTSRHPNYKSLTALRIKLEMITKGVLRPSSRVKIEITRNRRKLEPLRRD